MRFLAVLLLALLPFAACNKKPPSVEDQQRAEAKSEFPQPKFEKETSVIFPATRAAELTRQCSRSSVDGIEGVWDPTQPQIDLMEPGLAKLLTERVMQTPSIVSEVESNDYYRQYGGIIIGGRRTIYVNGFHKQILANAPPMDWHKDPVMVCDGGTSFWGVEYDVDSGSFSDFSFNGDA